MPMTPEQHLTTVREIAELKSQISGVAEDISKISTQMDRVWEMQNQISRLQQEQIDHKDSIKRIFGRVETSEDHGRAMNSRLEKWINMTLGGMVVGGALIGVINWLVLDKVNNFENRQIAHGDTLVTLDRRLSWAEYELKNKRDAKP